MCKVNIYEAKTNLSKYVEMLENGQEEEIVLCRYGKKVAKIVLFEESKETMRLGAAKDVLEQLPFSLEDVDGEIAKSFGY